MPISRKRKQNGTFMLASKKQKAFNKRRLRATGTGVVNVGLVDPLRNPNAVFKLDRTYPYTTLNAVPVANWPANMTPSVAMTDTGNGVQITGQIFFTLDRLSGYANYAAAFAQYRITKAIVKFIPRFDTNDQIGNDAVVTLGWFEDKTGLALAAPYLATEQAWFEKEGYYQETFKNERHVIMRPKPLIGDLLTGAPTFSFAQPTAPQWLPTTAPSVPHYGLNYKIAGYNGGGGAFANNQGNIFVTVTVEFRQPQ